MKKRTFNSRSCSKIREKYVKSCSLYNLHLYQNVKILARNGKMFYKKFYSMIYPSAQRILVLRVPFLILIVKKKKEKDAMRDVHRIVSRACVGIARDAKRYVRFFL